jgi:hypothetical protein
MRAAAIDPRIGVFSIWLPLLAACSGDDVGTVASASGTTGAEHDGSTRGPADTGPSPATDTGATTGKHTTDEPGSTDSGADTTGQGGPGTGSDTATNTETGTDTGGGEIVPCRPTEDPIVLQDELETDVPGAYPWVGYTGDFNGDGNLDLVTLNRDDDSVGLVIGDGAGGLTPLTPVAVPNFPKYAVVADFDHDGRDDVVVSSRNGSTVSFLAGGDTLAAPTSAITGLAPGFITAGDLDGDDELDLAVVNVSSSFRAAGFALGDGAGGFAELVWGEEFPYPHEMAYVLIGEHGGDASADLVVVTSEVFRSYIGDGALGFSELATLDAGFTEETTSVVADLDHDGWADLWHQVSGAQNQIAWGAAGGTFEVPTPFGLDAGSAGDLNGDGCYDIVGSPGINQLIVSRGHGDRTFTTEDPLPLNCSAAHSVVGDFDGDGRNDIAVIKGQCERVSLYLNAG